MGYTQRVVRGTAVYFFFSVTAAGINYLFRLLLAKELLPEEYGLFFGILAFIGALGLITFGFGITIAKFIPEYIVQKRLNKIRDLLRTSLFVLLILSLIFFSAVTLSSNFLAERYFNRFSSLPTSEVRVAIILLSFLLFVRIGTVIVAGIFQGFQKIDQLSLIRLTRAVAVLVLAFIFLKLNLGLFAPIIATLLGISLGVVIFYLIAVRIFPRPFDGSISRDMIIRLTKFTIPVILGSFGGALIDYTNSLVLVLRGLRDVAVYNVVFPTSMLTWFFPLALAVVMLPLSSEMWVKQDGRLKKGVELIHRYAFALVLPTALVMVAYPETLLRLLFGLAYVVGADALRIFAVGSVIYSIVILNITLLTGIGKPKLTSVVVLCGGAVCLALDLILTPILGVMGAAISTLISFIVMIIISTLMIQRYIKIKVPVLAWFKTMILGGIFLSIVYGVSSLIDFNILVEIFISVGLAGIVYLAGLFLSGVVKIGEIPKIR